MLSRCGTVAVGAGPSGVMTVEQLPL